jgi:hypothetical protein
MAKRTRLQLEEYFKRGDRPTQNEFAELIESNVNIVDDKATDNDIAGASDTKFVTALGAQKAARQSIKVNNAPADPVTGNISLDAITGNAATATKLQTPRNINGIPFDGTQDITLPVIAGPQGLKGDKGDKGDKGEQGIAGTSGINDHVNDVNAHANLFTQLNAAKVDKVQGKSLISDTEIQRLLTLANFDNTPNQQIIEQLAQHTDTKVSLTGNQSISDIKTFTSSPIVPVAVQNNQAVNFGQVTNIVNANNVNIITTVRNISSTLLSTQNATGFVAYLNSVTPNIAVGINEILKFQLTDTGRVFELNLRGRSFGVGQPAIVAANVIEITDFLNKDIRLSNYPSSRNDGPSPTNRVLGTDTNGNLRMFTIATSPAPYLEASIPNSILPSTTTDFTLKGAFFTPTMTVAIAGQTVNYITFISDNEVKVNVTTGATEGSYAITLNNGLSATFPSALLIVLGTVTIPIASDYTILTGTPDLSTNGEFKIPIMDVQQIATVFNIPPSDNFRVYFTLKRSPLGAGLILGPVVPSVSLVDASNNSMKFSAFVYLNGTDTFSNVEAYQSSTGFNWTNGLGNLESFVMLTNPPTCYFERVNGQYRLRDYNTNIVFTDTFTGSLKVRVDARRFDIVGLKYVKLN